MLISNSLAAVGLLFSPTKQTKYIGILGSMGIVTSVFGPSFGEWRVSSHFNVCSVIFKNSSPSFIATCKQFLNTYDDCNDNFNVSEL
ncbi:hypothetical protein [Liquorilactobacillus oeni]|uniref:hypothetical protein n=1 Tax=Liquorilactobacillus oeni TaxID=303241 RepID=UPI0012ED1F4C|nr:hypothetical protein [Liquorilactobacillus oeni]